MKALPLFLVSNFLSFSYQIN